jgi:hypothetical protein
VLGGPLTWTGGDIYTTVQCNGGNINVPIFSTLGYGRQLINTGPMTWTANSGPRTGGNNPNVTLQTVISNAASGTFNFALTNGAEMEYYAYGGKTAFYNASQLNVSGVGQTGYISDPFVNTGILNIQSGNLSVINGFASTNGTLNFGISSSTSYGTLALSGNFALNGTLGAIANGYAPSMGDSFPLITYGSEAGVFNAFNLPRDANWGFTYGQTVFTLYVVSVAAPYLTLQVIEPPLIPDGFTLLMLGQIGSNYMIEAATRPTLTNWVSLTNFTSVDTSFYYTDTTVTNHEARIFRAVMVAA